MQNNSGKTFRDRAPDRALENHIVSDKSENSTRLLLEKHLKEEIDWNNRIYPWKKEQLWEVILRGRIPKFDRFQDNYNGMGITVHDISAAHITIKALHIDNKHYRATVHYKVQDHFGLDSADILKKIQPVSFFPHLVCSAEKRSVWF